jgi:hypothetical protein
MELLDHELLSDGDNVVVIRKEDVPLYGGRDRTGHLHEGGYIDITDRLAPGALGQPNPPKRHRESSGEGAGVVVDLTDGGGSEGGSEGGGEAPPMPYKRPVLLLRTPELHTTNGGERFCPLEGWLPLSVRHGLVRKVTTIDIHATGAVDAKITLATGARSVLDAKEEISRKEGIPVRLQQMYLVLISEDGEDVREDDGGEDAGMELLDHELLSDGDNVVVLRDAPQRPPGWPAGMLTKEEADMIPLTAIELQGGRDPQFVYPAGLARYNRDFPPGDTGPRHR